MRILFVFLLHAIHFIHILFTRARLFWKQLSSANPKPLQAPRRQIPKHLAVVFIVDSNSADCVQTALIESALNVIGWCQAAGIPKLTLYEEHDRLSKCVKSSGYLDPTAVFAEKGLNTRRHDLRLCLVSRQSAKPAIASAAQSLAQAQAQIRNRKANHSCTSDTFQLSVDQFDELLVDEDGLSSPDFMIVQPISLDPSRYFTSAIELHGFSPWHIRLTEIYQNNKSSRFWVGKGASSASYLPPPLDEFSFRQALDEFASFEGRLGK